VSRDGQRRYPDLAIEFCLTLGMVFKQPLRQTQGMMRSIARLLGVEIAVPDFSTLSRRGNGLALRTKPRFKSDKPLQLVMDSTGLKIFGEGALSAACCACACRVRNGSSRSIKQSENGALSASSTLVLILSAGRSSALISLRTTSAIRRRCQIFWIKSADRLIYSSQTALTTETQHLIFLPLGSDR